MSVRRSDYGVAVMCGFGLNLAYVVPALWWLVLFGLVPFLAVLQRVDGKAAWKLGYVYGLAYAAGQLGWLGQLTLRWTGSVALALVPFVLASVLFALYFGLSSVLIQRSWAGVKPWLIPLVWAGVEVFRSYIPTFAFPWGLLAIPLAEAPGLLPLGALGTVFLGSAMVMLVNVMIIVRGRFALIGSAAFLTLLAGSYAYRALAAPTKPLRVAVVQTGVDMAFTPDEIVQRQLRSSVARLVAQADPQKPDVYCMTEGMADTRGGSVPVLPFEVPKNVPILFGSRRGTDPTFQSAYALENGKFTWADKTRLVVFGEFVPFRDSLPFLQAFHLPTGDMVPGQNGVQSLAVAGTRVGPMVCFEGLFPDIAMRQRLNGATWLWVPGIHDWFAGSTALMQLRQAGVWRAAEGRCPIAQSTPTGLTFVANLGVTQDLPVTRAGLIVADIRPTTPSLEWLRAIFPVVAFFAALGALFWRPKATYGNIGDEL